MRRSVTALRRIVSPAARAPIGRALLVALVVWIAVGPSAPATRAQAPEGAVVVHCHGGKDRTGIVVALLLRLAGVPIDEIAADYAISGERLRPRHEQWFASAESDEERTRIERIQC